MPEPSTSPQGREAADDATNPNQPPVARLRGPSGRIGLGETAEFDGTESSDPDGRLRRYEWAIERGLDVVASDTGTTFEYTFGRPGPHRVHLTVTDDDGAWDTATVAVDVRAHE